MSEQKGSGKGLGHEVGARLRSNLWAMFRNFSLNSSRQEAIKYICKQFGEIIIFAFH